MSPPDFKVHRDVSMADTDKIRIDMFQPLLPLFHVVTNVETSGLSQQVPERQQYFALS